MWRWIQVAGPLPAVRVLKRSLADAITRGRNVPPLATLPPVHGYGVIVQWETVSLVRVQLRSKQLHAIGMETPVEKEHVRRCVTR